VEDKHRIAVEHGWGFYLALRERSAYQRRERSRDE
jgi:hypothetical protein